MRVVELSHRRKREHVKTIALVRGRKKK